MSVPEGHFQLYSRIPPDLEAGDWRISADHDLDDDDGSVGSVQQSNVHFTINSPRYALPPGQVLSTFPPANSIGSYGSRLPQVVIKRRTLPWERLVDDDRPDTPWMALVLFLEGEARIDVGVPAAECFTEGVDLPRGDTLDDPEVGVGNRLVIRKSMVDRIFPTQQEVDVLAHAREVDINDTELAMGDDDGFLSVVVGNRLPVPGVDENGEETPVKYMAALVNLEGQFDKLLPITPDPVFFTPVTLVAVAQVATTTTSDHAVMDTAEPSIRVAADLGRIEALEVAGPGGPMMSSIGGSVSRPVQVSAEARHAATAYSGGAGWQQLDSAEASAQIYADMVAEFSVHTPAAAAVLQVVDEELRFPVLLSWSFTTSGQTTFKSLMQDLDSRLLGDTSATQPVPAGRLPLEVTETGHTGLIHRTRDGDEVRSWYRGPLVPHPMDNAASSRLALAHAADQLRVVTPDGREDLSLAAAFEVGRLLALSQPAIVAALLRWRQDHFRAARLDAVLKSSTGLFDALGVRDELEGLDVLLGDRWGTLVGRRLVGEVVINPDGFLGQPRPILTPGRPLEIEGIPSDLLATGLGLDAAVLRGQPDVVFEALRAADVRAVDLDIAKIGGELLLGGLQRPLDASIRDLGTDVLADGLVFDTATGPAFGAVGIPELIDTDLGDHFSSVLSGEFSAIDAIGGGLIDEVIREGPGGIDLTGGVGGAVPGDGILDGTVPDGAVPDGAVLDGTVLDGGALEGRSLGRIGRGGVPLSRSRPPDDDDADDPEGEG